MRMRMRMKHDSKVYFDSKRGVGCDKKDFFLFSLFWEQEIRKGELMK